MKVNFIVIGAAKSATTSLCNGLSLHPDICFSNPKEPQFFSNPDWRLKIENYHSHFKNDAKLYGEGSTNYTKLPLYNKNIPIDIYDYNSDMKFIYIIRHPIDRIVSHYIHAFNRGYETTDINTAINNNPHFLNLSKYYFQLHSYIEVFGRENVKLLFFDDFVNNPQKVLNDVYSFLNIDSMVIDKKNLNENKSFNKRVVHYKYDAPDTLIKKIKKIFIILNQNFITSKKIAEKPVISIKNKEMLIKALQEDIYNIEKLTNRDLSHWLKIN